MSDPLNISFIPGGGPNYEGIFIPPEPAVKHVPEWYKSLAKHEIWNDDKHLNPVNNIGGDGARVATKMCMPFFDSLTAGYYYLLEDDLLVELDKNGKPKLSWDKDIMIMDKRPTIDLPVPDNCHPIHYGWRMNWYYETPPGYSVLITHPMNRHDLPFITMSGIVESDIWGLPVFTAFFLKRGFQGVIKKGTPVFQIIPFKRDNWEMKIDTSLEKFDEHEFKAENRRSMLYGYYKKTAWIKKIFGTKGIKEDYDE
jgi:hypothetical protein